MKHECSLLTPLSITDTSAVWVYIHNGAVIPMMVVPLIVGIMGEKP